MSHTEELIRITTLIPRKKGMTQEAFYKHWETVHGPMVVDFMMRHGVVEYRQVRPQVDTGTIPTRADEIPVSHNARD